MDDGSRDPDDRSGRPDQVGTAAALQAALGLYALAVAAILAAAPAILPSPIPTPAPGGILQVVFFAAAGALVVVGTLNLVAAWGVHRGREWGRILAIVLAVLALASVPVGTILGALVLYLLTRDPVEAHFRRRGTGV